MLGARLYDVERVAMAVAALGGITFEAQNPTTSLMADRRTGRLRPEVLEEFVLSAIIEFSVPLSRVPEVLCRLKAVSAEIDSVFSLDISTRVGEANDLPTERVVRDEGLWISPNGKTNVGLGRPLRAEG